MTREIAITIMERQKNVFLEEYVDFGTVAEAYDMAIEALAQERKTGKWIEDDDEIISGHCSVCGWSAILYETDVVGMPYCPNCGADMRGGQDA